MKSNLIQNKFEIPNNKIRYFTISKKLSARLFNPSGVMICPVNFARHLVPGYS